MSVQYLVRPTAGLAIALTSAPAHAHLGHIGELAGHSHWIGLGAVGVAGVIAATAALLPKRKRELAEDTETEEAGDDETEEATA